MSVHKVTELLEHIGMWTPENKSKYEFRLSPDVFVIDGYQISQLEELAKILRKLFETKTAGKFPLFCKVDLMINTNGELRVAEIDGLNKRAFGYAVLERKIAEMFGQNTTQFFSGIEHSLGRIGSRLLFVVVPGREKYYKYGFNVLTERLREVGIETKWCHEKETFKFLSSNDPSKIVLLDCPKTGHEKLDALLDSRSWETLIPNEPFFSSKANLVGLENPLVPKTLELGSVTDIPFEKYVIKHIGRSGCKGVYFYDEPGEKVDSSEYIVQEFVSGKEFEFSYFDGTTLIKSGGWQVRLIATLDLEEFRVIDLDVTACQNRLVHGTADSIQIAGVKK